MAACVARNFFSTGCRVFLAQTNARRFQIQRRAFSYSRCLAASRMYTEKHEWVLLNGKAGTVGISDYAQDNLGEIVYVDLPEVDSALSAGDVAGCVESVKAASDIYCPVDGKVTEVNKELETNPDLVNKSPLDKGWLYKMEVDEGADTSALMNEEAYKKFLQSEEHH